MIETLLIAAGIALLIGEAFIPLFGLIGLSGLALIITGILISFNESFIDYGWHTLFGVSFAIAALIGGGGFFAFKHYRKQTQTGREGLIGAPARVIDWSGKQGRVMVDGESWHAESPKKLDLQKDDMVDILSVEGLSLIVIPQDPQQEQDA